METAQQKLIAVKRQIEEACLAAKRPGADIDLIAISKTQPAAAIRQFASLGVKRFGENYAQELWRKAAELADLELEWIFVGALQSNKINKLVEVCSEIQTVSSLRHAEIIANAARHLGKAPFPIYLAVNAAPDLEPQKHGATAEEAAVLAQEISRNIKELNLLGLMAVPPPLPPRPKDAPLKIPELYKELAALALNVGRGKLSLGMSDDLAEAIGAGATSVRIGSALFGPRPRQP